MSLSAERGTRRGNASLFQRAAPGILFAILVAGVWSNPLFTRRNFTGRDLLAYNLPMEKVIHDTWASGHLPLWNPWISGGRPLFPNPNSGAAYPVRILLSVFSFPFAMRLYPPLHWTAAGLGVLALLRALGIGRRGAWLGAATYAFSGVSISQVFYPHIQPGYALLPWIVWAVVARRRLGAWGTLLLALFFGVDFLAGDVFTSGIAFGAGVLWIVTEMEPASRGREALALTGATVLGAMLALPQIVATALWIPLTNRAISGITLSEATRFSISPWRLLEFLAPYPFGATWQLDPDATWATRVFNGKSIGLFSTLFVGAIGPLAVFRLRGSQSPGLRFSRWMLAVGLAMAVLPSLLPRDWLLRQSPLALRNPEKLVVAAVLALAIFAARGFESFVASPPARRASLGAGALFLAAALACAAFPEAIGRWAAAELGRDALHARLAGRYLPGAIAEGGVLWMATLVALEGARSRRRIVPALSLLLLALVAIVPSSRIPEISAQEEAFSPSPLAMRLSRSDPDGAFRVLGESAFRRQTGGSPRAVLTTLEILEFPRREWIQHTGALWNRGTVLNGDFDAGDLSRVESLRRLSMSSAGLRDFPTFFGNIALRWGVRARTQEPVAGYRRIGGDPVQDWDEQRPSYPDIRLATRWREEPGPVEALGRLSGMAPGEVVVETGHSAAGAARPGTVSVIEKRPGRVRLEYDAPDPTWLFVLRDFWPYRSVELDGRPIVVVPAYLAFSAVPVPAGHHSIDWREEVPGLALSAWGPVVFVGVSAVLLWRRRPRGLPGERGDREKHRRAGAE